MNKTGKGGFGDKPEELRKETARKGGLVKNPKKGFGSMTKKQRSESSKRALKIRWDKHKAKEKNEN